MLYCDNIFKSYGHYNNVVHTCRVLPKINTLEVFSTCTWVSLSELHFEIPSKVTSPIKYT